MILILMDVQMPGMDGLEATRAIRALPQRASTLIVAVTANAFDGDRQACQAAGMNDFVAKPIEARLLHTVLLKWLDRATALSPRAPARLALAPVGGESVRRDSVVPVLDELERLLDAGDTAAIDVINARGTLLRDELGPIGKTLERQVRLYAVDRAQATQRSLRRARNPRPDGPGIGTG